jgi:putative ABC transport system permease protein
MFKTHLKRVLRNFSHNSFFAFINLSVLVTGITSCILVILYIIYQSDFDAHHAKADRIFRLSTDIRMGQGGDKTPQTSVHLGDLLKKKTDFVEDYVRFNPFNFESFKIHYKDYIFTETNILGTEPNVFRVFTHTLLAGNPVTALKEPNSIVLTESLAKKYFHTIDCLGEILKIDQEDYSVTGVIKDLPNNSDLNFRALITYDFGDAEDWDDMKYFTYVLLKDENDAPKLESALKTLEELYVRPYYKETGMNINLNLFFTPLRKVHFLQGLVYDTPKSNYMYVYIFIVIGFFTLSIASFNYINLAAVQSFNRSKEVAVQEVLGVRRWEIIKQFVTESLILTIISLFISLAVVGILLPSFNSLAQIKIPMVSIFSWKPLLMILCVVLILGVVSAVVPALYLTSFELSKILKGKLPNFNRRILYKGLLIAQFAMSVAMIICTLAVYQQMKYMKDKDLGFLLDKVIVVHLPDENGFNENSILKKELSKYSSMNKVSLIGEAATPGSIGIEKSEAVVEREGEEAIMDVFNVISVDENYFDLLNIRVMQGRNFDQFIEGDMRHSVIVNEAFVRQMGWKDPINKRIEFHGESKVIGVVKDYNYKSLHNKIEPLIIHYNIGGPNNEMLVKISSSSDIEIIRKTWKKYSDDRLFQFTFLDNRFNEQYQQENATMTLFFLFSMLVIMLTCLGLFGLSSLVTKQRIREIGIRKVLGGTEINIIYVLLKDTVILLFLSIFIAAPLAKYAIGIWQNEFKYQAQIGVLVYFLAWTLALLTTLLTAFYHTFKAVNTNPALALRDQ